MTISKQEAADALRDITKTERRTVSSLGYQMAWPHLIIWGVIWLIGYSAMAGGVTWDYLWLALSGIGSLASFVAGYATAQRHGKGFDGRFLATFAIIFLFVSAVFIVLPPRSQHPIWRVLPHPRRALLCADRNLDAGLAHAGAGRAARWPHAVWISPPARALHGLDGGGRRRRADPWRLVAEDGLTWTSPIRSSTSRYG